MYNEIYEDVNIREYIRIIIKKKYFILVILLLFIFIGFFFPKNKKAITYLEVNPIFENEPYNIAGKIEAGFYGNYSSKIEANNLGSSQLLKIVAFSRNYQAAIGDLEKLNNSILLEKEEELKKQNINLEKITKELGDRAFLIFQDKQKSAEIIGSEIIKLKTISDLEPTVKVIINPQISQEKAIYSVLKIIIWGTLGIIISLFCIFTKEWWSGQKEKK